MVQARVQRNDARILGAVTKLAANQGWAEVTFSGVGREAGLSVRPVRDRYPTRALLGADTWVEVAGPALAETLNRALSASGLLDGPVDEVAFAAAMDELTVPNDSLKAAVELIVVSCFEPDIRGAINASLAITLGDWLDPIAAGTPARAAKRGYLLILALGLIATRRPGVPDLDMHPQWNRLLAAFATDLAPTPLPDEPRPAFLTHIPFDTGDPITDNVLRAAIDLLGRYGYEGTLLPSVAADANITEASIYLRYPSKEAFIIDAINRQQDIALPGQRAYLARLEERYGVGVAEAIAIRDTMHPREYLINVIDMEHLRLTWHRPNLAAEEEARLQNLVREVLANDPTNQDFADPARLHISRALGVGIGLLPLIDGQAWQLPYDVATTPLTQI